MNVPALRFKDDDGQEFPEWEEKTLGELCDVKGGKRIPKGYYLQYESNGLPYITVTDMYKGGVNSKYIRYVPTEVAELIKNYKITTNDIFISVAGTLGIVGIIPKELNNANLTENANKLTNLRCHQHYLLQYLMSDRLVNLIDNVQTVGAQPKLAIYALNRFEVSIPSLPEQTKIANFLTAIDEKIAQLTQKGKLLTQYKKGVMQQIFSQEFRFKDDDGQEFPEWEEKMLGEVSDRVIRKNKEDNKNVLTISAQYGLIDQKDYFNKSVSAKILTNYYLLHLGDFAYNKSYSNGYPMGAIKCLNRYEKGVVSTLYICFKFKDSFLNKFFEQYFEAGLQNQEIEKVAQEGARNHGLLNIGLDDFFSIRLTVPSLPEQTKIANFLTAIDEKITNNQTQLDAVKQYKQGLLQQMFV